MQRYTHPFKRRMMATSIALTGSLALGGLSACGGYEGGGPSPQATQTYSYAPTLSAEQKNADETLHSTALQIVDKIAADARNPQSCAFPSSTYNVSNWPAMQANNSALVDTRLPQIAFEYLPANNIVTVQSIDLDFQSNDAITTDPFNGIAMEFSLPEPVAGVINGLDVVIRDTGQLQLQDFQDAIHGNGVTLKSVAVQTGHGVDYKKDTLYRQNDATYQISQEVASLAIPTTQHAASPAEMNAFDNSLFSTQDILTQGVNVQCP